MVLAKLSNGVELDYRDSGKPEVMGCDGGYETLLCVHGVMFNQEIFSPLLTSGLPGVRVITYNHRGYPGSSPLKPHELGDPISTRTLYLRDLVSFLEYTNNTIRIPRKPIVISFEKGGNLLLGLASPTFLPKGLRANGVANAKCLIIHDCPGNGLGRVPTCDLVKATISCPYSPSPAHSQPTSPTAPSSPVPIKGRPVLPSYSSYGYGSTSSSTSSDADDGGRIPQHYTQHYQHHNPILHQSPNHSHHSTFYRNQAQTRAERHMAWICGFYKHQNHLPRDPHNVEPAYSSWAYKCSSEILPSELMDNALEIGKNISIQQAGSSMDNAMSSPTSTAATTAHLWKLCDDRQEQIEFARMALVKQADIPIALVWNGESPESSVDAAREGGRIGSRVFLVGAGGNSLMFAHEPREWTGRVLRVAREIVGTGAGVGIGGEGVWLV
ncbi:hypothetical protein DFH27DRAFT_615204 [Peziza echinospora]|nr:hypothetical protein DFH27DRAFT_615204 [Peziza echinospora]